MEPQLKSFGIQKTAIIAAIASLLVFCVAAWAGSDSPRQVRWPCAEDFEKYCKDAQPSGGGIGQCLDEHENDLSAACREAKKRRLDLQEACWEDRLRLCKDMQPGGGRLIECMKAHEAELSSMCREKLPKGIKGK